jgi:hypothetical protein
MDVAEGLEDLTALTRTATRLEVAEVAEWRSPLDEDRLDCLE